MNLSRIEFRWAVGPRVDLGVLGQSSPAPRLQTRVAEGHDAAGTWWSDTPWIDVPTVAVDAEGRALGAAIG